MATGKEIDIDIDFAPSRIVYFLVSVFVLTKCIYKKSKKQQSWNVEKPMKKLHFVITPSEMNQSSA